MGQKIATAKDEPKAKKMPVLVELPADVVRRIDAEAKRNLRTRKSQSEFELIKKYSEADGES